MFHVRLSRCSTDLRLNFGTLIIRNAVRQENAQAYLSVHIENIVGNVDFEEGCLLVEGLLWGAVLQLQPRVQQTLLEHFPLQQETQLLECLETDNR